MTMVRGCARCEGEHDVVFKALTHPVELEGGDIAYTHWAPCPHNDEPILMRMVPAPEPGVVVGRSATP